MKRVFRTRDETGHQAPSEGRRRDEDPSKVRGKARDEIRDEERPEEREDGRLATQQGFL